MAGLHPLDWQDHEAEWLGQSLRTASPDARLVSDTRGLGAGDWLVVRPGQSWPLGRILEAAWERQPRGLVVDEHDRAAVGAWLQVQRPDAPGHGLELRVLPQLAQRMGILASSFYSHPSHRMELVAITGTNGKSTAVHFLAQAWARLGHCAASIGTLGVRRFEPRTGDGQPGLGAGFAQWASPGLTSWDPVGLQGLLHDLSQSGVTRAALEASSIGLVQYRLTGCRLSAAGLTSLASDHLDFHGSLSAYGAAKAGLFEQPGLRRAVVAMPLRPVARGLPPEQVPGVLPEQPLGEAWAPIHRALEALPAGALTQVSVDRDSGDPGGKASSPEHSGAWIDLSHPEIEGLDQVWQARSHSAMGPVSCRLPLGRHQAQNAAVVIGLLVGEGCSLEQAVGAVSGLSAPEGRLSAVRGVDAGRPAVWVDYAHTADGLEQICLALDPLVKARDGRLCVVFGCGGERDRLKRPEMARVADALADRVVVTADNPRSEPLAQIMQEILAGIPQRPHARVESEPDRAAAIRLAVGLADPRDGVLIAGKGHEQTQLVMGQALPFSDSEQAERALSDYRPPQTLADLCGRLSGALLLGCRAALDRPVEGVTTDSRSLRKGDVFVALCGERHNGHQFVEAVVDQGAVAVVVSEPVSEAVLERATVIRVPDTLHGLGELAAAWRSAFVGQVWAVTGSNGKTTVKEMLQAISRADLGAAAAWATPGNLNNAVGLPLSLLGIRPQHRRAVLEIGMNHPGEIAPLAAWTRPDAAIVTNAQREHQAFMGTVEACARENGLIFQQLSRPGIAVFPMDAAHEAIWTEQAQGHRCLRFGLMEDFPGDVSPAAGLEDVRGLWRPGGADWPILELSLGGEVQRIPLRGLGRHFARNACGAAALAYAAGVSPRQIAAGLSGFSPVRGRGTLERLPGGDWLVDDTYNANPDSVLAAIEALAERAGPRALVLGDMGEVGQQGPAFHCEVLRAAQARGIEAVWLLGSAFHAAQRETGIGQPMPDGESVAQALLEWLRHATARAPSGRATVWFKGSRFMQLEKTLQAVRDAAQSTHVKAEDAAHTL